LTTLAAAPCRLDKNAARPLDSLASSESVQL
jgi:hypothetical protein